MPSFPRQAWYRPPVGAWAVVVCLWACSKDAEPKVPGAPGENRSASAVVDGPALFLTHCAPCHGQSGDGKGSIPLDRPARSFVDGGFSFGNTPDALLRTITHGIGGSPMPGFGAVLTLEELQAVVQQVIALGPPQDPAAKPEETRLAVGDRAVVVRGGLPALADGLPGHPRGLLVGNTDGLSWEYSSQPLRLLAVRQGLFCDRKDWQSRGGDPIEPLGKVMYRMGDGNPAADWNWVGPEGPSQALEARLLATTIVGGSVQIESEWSLPDVGTTLVVESGEALTVGDLVGFRRTFDVAPWRGSESLRFAEDAGDELAQLGLGATAARITQKRSNDGQTILRVSHAPQTRSDGSARLQEDWLFVPGDVDAALKTLTETLR